MLIKNVKNEYNRVRWLKGQVYSPRTVCLFQVIDLLNPTHRRILAVRWSKHRGFYVENLFVIECEGMDDLMAVLEEGRNITATQCCFNVGPPFATTAQH